MADTEYFSARLEVRPFPEKGHFGIFAREFVPAGEVLVVWSGRIVAAHLLPTIDPLLVSRSVQVEEDLYLVPYQSEAADYINHSCNPNAGLSGQITLMALRAIQPGEEICYDYAMTDGSPYDEFECQCLQPNCRHRITGNDWQLPELQRRYAGHFSPYLQRRIERLRLAEHQAQAASQ